jgi:hypothetical protein
LGCLAFYTVLAVEGICLEERGSTLLTTCHWGRLVWCTGICSLWVGLAILPYELGGELAVDIGQEKTR